MTDKPSERTPKGKSKTYRVALYEMSEGKAELLDLFEFDARSTKFDARSTKGIFRTLHNKLTKVKPVVLLEPKPRKNRRE